MGRVLDFLFGKSPNVFDQSGRIAHQLPNQKWKLWNDRYQAGEDYNWKNHTGRKAKDKKRSS